MWSHIHGGNPMILDSVDDWNIIGAVLDELTLRCEEIEKWGFETWYQIEEDGKPKIYVRSIGEKM